MHRGCETCLLVPTLVSPAASQRLSHMTCMQAFLRALHMLTLAGLFTQLRALLQQVLKDLHSSVSYPGAQNI